MTRPRWRRRALVAAAVLAWGSTAGAGASVAPGYRVEVVLSDVPHVIDAVEPFRDVLLVSTGAESPGSRLLRFTVVEGDSAPVALRSGEALVLSRSRLGPIVTYPLTGRIYLGMTEPGQILQLPPVTLDLSTLARWEPEPFVVGLTAVHDFAFAADGRLLVAAGSRILEAPVYFTPPTDAARLRTIHHCPGACQGVAVAGDGGVLVLESDGQGGRAVRRDLGGTVHVVAAGLPRPGEGLRVGPRGDLFLTSEAGLLRVTPAGQVVRVLSPLGERSARQPGPRRQPARVGPRGRCGAESPRDVGLIGESAGRLPVRCPILVIDVSQRRTRRESVGPRWTVWTKPGDTSRGYSVQERRASGRDRSTSLLEAIGVSAWSSISPAPAGRGHFRRRASAKGSAAGSPRR